MPLKLSRRLLLSAALPAQAAPAQDLKTWLAHRPAIVLYRHALAPGGGDPAGFALGDCATQRNLSPQGREQAKRMGAILRAALPHHSHVVVWHSQWCRTQETAEQIAVASAKQTRAAPQFNSFFGNPETQGAQTQAALRALSDWQSANALGLLVVVTHQVNVTSLTGVVPAPGEGVVVRVHAGGQALEVLGRVAAP